MMIWSRIVLAACALVLALPACSSSRSKVPGVTVLPGRHEPLVTVEVYPRRVVFDIESASGLGNATIEFAKEFRAKRVSLRLHLRGLEELRFSYEGREILVSLSSTGQPELREAVRIGGVEQSLTADDPRWMAVRVVGAATPDLAGADKYFEVDAPADFFKSRARRFSVEWVDYFR